MFTNCFVVVSLAPNIIHSEIKYRALLGNAATTGKRQWGAPLQSQDFNIFFFFYFSPRFPRPFRGGTWPALPYFRSAAVAGAFSADRQIVVYSHRALLAGWLAGCGFGWRHARARITQVCLEIAVDGGGAAVVAVDDLLVITRPHRTQLYLPTQSISQGTTMPPPPPPPQPTVPCSIKLKILLLLSLITS